MVLSIVENVESYIYFPHGWKVYSKEISRIRSLILHIKFQNSILSIGGD